MRHAKAGKKLGRDAAHRKALYSNLAGALITHGRIETTEAKAKAVRPLAEKMITLGKRGDLHARRQAMAELRSNDVVHKLFADVAPRFAEREGGYTRIVKLGPRQGDAASMALLELVDHDPREGLGAVLGGGRRRRSHDEHEAHEGRASRRNPLHFCAHARRTSAAGSFFGKMARGWFAPVGRTKMGAALMSRLMTMDAASRFACAGLPAPT